MTSIPSLVYVCSDEVNRAQVEGWLDVLGGVLANEPEEASACLIDLDHLPFGMSPADVLGAGLPKPAAAHAYHPDRFLRRLCRKHDVKLVRRLTYTLVRKLLNIPAAVPTTSKGDDICRASGLPNA